jgi:hypothetical protein
MAIVSAVLWLIWLFVWLYSDFGASHQVLAIPREPVIDNEAWLLHDVNYIVYYALIVIFAVWIGLILGEYSRKSLVKSLVVLVVSCLLWWLFRSLSSWFYWSLCWWCDDYIAYSLWIFFLLFLLLWFVSLFYVIKYLTNSNKWWTIVLLICLGVVGAVLVLNSIFCKSLILPLELSWLDCLEGLLDKIFWVFLIISIILCIVAWIKRYKESKKSE